MGSAAAHVGDQGSARIEALLETFVSRNCYEPLRLATANLPENFSKRSTYLSQAEMAYFPARVPEGDHEVLGVRISMWDPGSS